MPLSPHGVPTCPESNAADLPPAPDRSDPPVLVAPPPAPSEVRASDARLAPNTRRPDAGVTSPAAPPPKKDPLAAAWCEPGVFRAGPCAVPPAPTAPPVKYPAVPARPWVAGPCPWVAGDEDASNPPPAPRPKPADAPGEEKSIGAKGCWCRAMPLPGAARRSP